MSEALKGICETLTLNLVDDAATRLVAQKIIELARRGVRDVATLRTGTQRDSTNSMAAFYELNALRHFTPLTR